MKRVISLLQTIRLRQLVAGFILGITLLLSSGGGYAQAQPFTAEPMTPEANSYQVDRTDADHVKNKAQDAGKDVIENSENKIKSVADNIREKLNLDEPLPRSTKEFLNDVQGKDD
jgi:hypothetical protein